MYVLKLIVCNVLWYWLCMFLIVFGFMIVVFVFGLLYIVVDVWYVGVVVVFSGWFVMCNVILLVFLLLVSYENCICGVDGVMVVVCLNWFGGIYCDLKNFFVSFVVLENYFDLYLEFILLVQQCVDYNCDCCGCFVGCQFVMQFGFKVGDVILLKGMIYLGMWDFVVCGIFDGCDDLMIMCQLVFYWDYLNEMVCKCMLKQVDQVGVFVFGVVNFDDGVLIVCNVDVVFKNLFVEMLIEIEQVFQFGFVVMLNQIIVVICLVLYVVILIIMVVMVNVMVMSVCECMVEYVMLKVFGFGFGFFVLIVFGELVVIVVVGGGFGIFVMLFVVSLFKQVVGGIFLVFKVLIEMIVLQVVCLVVVGFVVVFVLVW